MAGDQLRRDRSATNRLESIMLQNLPIMLFGISLIFCLLAMLVLCFLDMDYTIDNILPMDWKHITCAHIF